ncbi:hypothetical protein LNV09_15220 [Paucibacter sp. B2R-40]|uniref:hypothetical protein n=1 Tax=Paucibacter sp. B2R-40 TaxID=2893554 RepID=UPI0021E4AB70|nr:hypothetical protein [Paucibacter sp. B2R-40]MCV2355500.1 hypothetical protein [Paucibacter sp. B2R-40]
MKVLHLSHTPLVGAPGQICQAIQQHGIDARWVVLKPDNYSGLSFSLDWRWENNLEEVLSFAKSADILHLHNYIDLDCKDFPGLNFRELWNSGKPMVRHFHSNPKLIANYMGQTEQALATCPLPKLVVAQYQERYFPTARVVPNLVSAALPARSRIGLPLRVGYAPSNFRSARSSRWDTKGYPETVRVLNRTISQLRKRGTAVELDLITQVPHAQCIERKSNCDLFIDDLVTGSYHLNTLESLAQGCATLCHIDDRTKTTLGELLGRDDFPALDVRLEHLSSILDYFALQPDLARAIGTQSKQWMDQYWSPAQMATHFITAYQAVIEQPSKAFSHRFDESPVASYRTQTHHDQVWQARHASWPELPPQWWTNSKYAIGQLLRKYK